MLYYDPIAVYCIHKVCDFIAQEQKIWIFTDSNSNAIDIFFKKKKKWTIFFNDMIAMTSHAETNSWKHVRKSFGKRDGIKLNKKKI